MPVDYSIPLQVQTPAPMAGLASILNVVQGVQGIEQQNIQLQAQRQANDERKNFISLMQQDPAMRPGPDGTFDLGPANTAKILAAMPQTGADQIQKLADTNQKMTQARQSVFDLGINNAKAFGQAVNDLSGKPVSDRVAALQDLQSQFPGTKPFVDMYTHALNQVQSSGVSDQQKNEALGNLDQFWSRWHMDILNQQTAGTPQYGTLQTGGKVNVFQTKPGVPGAPQTSPLEPTGTASMTLGPGEREHLEQDPVTKQAVIVRRNESGTIISARPAAGLSMGTGGQGPQGAQGSAFTAIPPGETVDTLNQLQAQRAASNAAARGAGAVASNNKQILSLLNAGTTTGSNAPFIQRWMSSVGLQWVSDEGKNLDNIAHYLALQQQANENAMGVRTDAGREVSGLASGQITMSTDALKSAIKANDALNTGTAVFNTGLEKAIAQKGIGAARTFQNQWAPNFDPMIYRYANAINSGDKTEQVRIEKQYGKPEQGKIAAPDSSWGRFVTKMRNLDSLENNGALPVNIGVQK